MTTDRRDRPPLPTPLGPLLEPIYRAVVAQRNRAFDKGRRVTKVGRPVISIGNLSVGGTGKTPAVIWLVETLASHGIHAGIVMRGYGVDAAAGELSDEHRAYNLRLPQTPVVAHPKRVLAAQRLLADHPVDCIVMDDGFQHRKLARDFNIVLIDATREPFTHPLESRCLPAGWLREPTTSLNRADAVIITHADRVAPPQLAALKARLTKALPTNTPIATAHHAWAGLVDTLGNPVDPALLEGAPVAAACGIGNPTPFLNAIAALGPDLTARTLLMPDHHPWSDADIPALTQAAANAHYLITTDKDWVKLRDIIPPELAQKALLPKLTLAIEHADHIIESCLRIARPTQAAD